MVNYVPERTVGFTSGNNFSEEHSDYLGKPGQFVNQWGNVAGIYVGTETDKYGISYALFNPSVVYDGKNKAIIDHSKNSKLIMPLVVIRPMATSLEKFVELINSPKDKSISKRRK